MKFPWLDTKPSEEQREKAAKSLHSLLEDDERIISQKQTDIKTESLKKGDFDQKYNEFKLDIGESLNIYEGENLIGTIDAYPSDVNGTTMQLEGVYGSHDIRDDEDSHYGAGDKPISHYMFVRNEVEDATRLTSAAFDSNQDIESVGKSSKTPARKETEEPLVLYLEPEVEETESRYKITGMKVWNLSDRELDFSQPETEIIGETESYK